MAGPAHSPAMPRNLGTGGPTGGTLGGFGRLGAGGGLIPQGDALYLWVLVILEVLAISWLRTAFKRYHGG